MAQPWFAYYVDDYERKTADLSMLQHGAYGELIRRYYMCGGPLPANAEQVHRMCRAMDDAERAAIDYCLQRFFILMPDGWHHNRCDEELAKAREISEKRAKSATFRHSKCNANAPAIAEQMQTQLQPHTHITTNPPISPQKFELPIWIPERAWMDYEQMRAKKKHPLTDRARKMAVTKLEKLMNQGQNVEAVIYQSVFRTWDDFYDVKEETDGQNRPQRVERISAATARNQRNDDIFANVLRERHGDIAMAETGSATEPGRDAGGGFGPVLAKEPIVLPPRRN